MATTPNAVGGTFVVTLDDAAIERLVQEARVGGRLGVRTPVRSLPPAGLSLHRQPRPPPVGRGGPDAARLRQGPGSAAALRGAGHPVRGLALPAGQERGHRSRPDAARPRRPRRRPVDQPGADAGPDEVTVARQELDEVAAALAALTDEQRDAIALRFFAGLSAREAAEVMGKQEGTIRGLQFRAIAALAAAAPDRRARHRTRRRRRERWTDRSMSNDMIDLDGGGCTSSATPRGVRRRSPDARAHGDVTDAGTRSRACPPTRGSGASGRGADHRSGHRLPRVDRTRASWRPASRCRTHRGGHPRRRDGRCGGGVIGSWWSLVRGATVDRGRVVAVRSLRPCGRRTGSPGGPAPGGRGRGSKRR